MRRKWFNFIASFFKTSLFMFICSLFYDLHIKADTPTALPPLPSTTSDYNAKMGKLHSLNRETVGWGLDAVSQLD
jgi:hypothetical protein